MLYNLLVLRRTACFDSGVGNQSAILGDAGVLLVADGVLVERAGRQVDGPRLKRLEDDSHNRRLRSAPTLIQESKLLLLSPSVPALPLGQSDSFRSSVCKMR